MLDGLRRVILRGILILATSTCLLCVYAFELDETEDKMEWKSDYILSWNDFKGTADPRSEHEAITHTLISLSSRNVAGMEVKIVVRNFFLKDQSWKKADQNSELILKHEQTHFDLSEVTARRIRKKCAEMQMRSMKELQNWLNKIYKQEMEISEAEQQQYDEETKHSIDRHMQEKWNNKVQSMLLKLEKYSNPEFVIYLRP